MIDSAPLLVTSILLAIIHYFENSYRSEFSETYSRLQDADEKIMSRVLSNRRLNKGGPRQGYSHAAGQLVHEKLPASAHVAQGWTLWHADRLDCRVGCP